MRHSWTSWGSMHILQQLVSEHPYEGISDVVRVEESLSSDYFFGFRTGLRCLSYPVLFNRMLLSCEPNSLVMGNTNRQMAAL